MIFPRWKIITSGFFRAPAPGVGIMQYVYALNPVCVILVFRHSRRRFYVRDMDLRLIQEYNDGHRTWHTLININNMKFQLIV